MSKVDWSSILKWDDEQLDAMRLTGYAYIRQGKYDIAHDLFQALVIIDNQNAYDLQTLGALHLEMDEASSALEILEQALKQEPEHLPTQLNYAKALFMLGRNEEGVQAAQKLKSIRDFRIGSTARALLLAHS